jgi:hypothetical protein
MNLVNCTPHDVRIVRAAPSWSVGWTRTVPPSGPVTTRQVWLIRPSGTVTRVEELTELVGHTRTAPPVVDEEEWRCPVMAVTYGAVQDLPDEVDGTVYIVARMVAEALPERRDLVFPLFPVRDADGRVTGCEALGQVGRALDDRPE